MINRGASYPTPEDISGSGDVDTLTEMRATMDELFHHNQMLEDDVHNIRQRQKKGNP